MTATADETTPLLVPGKSAISTPGPDSDSASGITSGTFHEDSGRFGWLRSVVDVENRILFAGFLITLSFSFTQVGLFYVFHLMECDVYYGDHPNPPPHHGGRCSRDEIAAGTATMISILGMSTTLCGTVNLFVAGWTVKKFGARAALICQTVVPAIRVATQIIGVMAGRRAGMIIIQATQLITVLGGPAGYILIINIIAGEVVEPERRTAVFGMLQGAIMLGQGLGYLTGGMIGDAIDIKAPFQTAFISFLVAAVYVRFALPYISPESIPNAKKAGSGGGGVAGFFAPLKILAPRRVRLPNGKIRKHYGVLFLCGGIFVGVLATGYAPLLIQMYATAAFDFNQSDNGWLMSEFAFMRSLFLLLLFPRIISLGRRLTSVNKTTTIDPRRGTDPESAPSDSGTEVGDTQTYHDVIPREPAQFHATAGEQADEEPVQVPPPAATAAAASASASSSRVATGDYTFDLVFLRWSLVVDGALTTVAALATKSWHIYLAAALIPFGSGSAPAAKGVITEMCSDAERPDALNAVTLVENVARLATQGLFGFVFSSLAGVGRAYATFYCNAAVALIGAGVLLLSNFPPAGAYIVDDSTTTTGADAQQDDEEEPLVASSG